MTPSTQPKVPASRRIIRAAALLGVVAVGLAARPAAAGFEAGIAAFVLGDLAGAAQEWRLEARRDSAVAQYNLAVLYAEGLGVERDYAVAARLYQQAARQGLDDAAYNLGLLYARRLARPDDYTDAARWYREAAEQGFAEAQFRLARLYAQGRGVAIDFDAALGWYRRAASQGHGEAMLAVAWMYDAGRGTPRDPIRARRWYRQAAAAGQPEAQMQLGLILRDGIDAERDLPAAFLWLSLAARGHVQVFRRGDAEAAARRVLARLRPAEARAARAALAAWRPRRSAGRAKAGQPGLPPSRPLMVPASVDLVTPAQVGLAALGYDPGPADGVAGDRTAAAVRAFRRARGLPQGAGVTPALIRAIAAEQARTRRSLDAAMATPTGAPTKTVN